MSIGMSCGYAGDVECDCGHTGANVTVYGKDGFTRLARLCVDCAEAAILNFAKKPDTKEKTP